MIFLQSLTESVNTVRALCPQPASQTAPESAEYRIPQNKKCCRHKQCVCLCPTQCVCVCVSSYPVCIQLCLHGGDVAPYRRLLLQLLTLQPQPVEKLLQRHVEPLPRGHLRVQVGSKHTNRHFLLSLLYLNSELSLSVPTVSTLTSC